MRIKLPANTKFPEGQNFVECEGVLVVIGANGSGKTRLGVWFENSEPHRTHRVSAQKSLQFPNEIRPMDSQLAATRLRVGDQHGSIEHRRSQVRWQSAPETALLNDFNQLLEYLFSEHNDQCNEYVKSMKGATVPREPPETKIEKVKRIWEATLPKRELVVGGADVQARKRGDTGTYHAKNLSDGERVIFYLTGEALTVPPNGIFIVDEPELHLHRAIQARLWDAIEAKRPDCLFIYLTHDLDFAASRQGAAKIWLREFTSNQWDWDVVPDSNSFAEPMFLELLGSRKPILFVEGDKGSLDYLLYGKLYPEWTIMPVSSCEQVIHATASFTAMKELHANSCRGLVDFDARPSEDAARLKVIAVEVLPFAEIENVFLIEPVLRYAAKTLGLDEEKTVKQVQERVLEMLTQSRETVVSALAANELETAFRSFDAKAKGEAALDSSFKAVVTKVDAAKIYQKWDAEIGRVLAKRDYTAALKFYSNKGLASTLGGIFQTRLPDLIKRKLRSPEAATLVQAMQAAVPKLS